MPVTLTRAVMSVSAPKPSDQVVFIVQHGHRPQRYPSHRAIPVNHAVIELELAATGVERSMAAGSRKPFVRRNAFVHPVNARFVLIVEKS